MRKLPIGIQSFKNIIEDGYIYVDKTEYIHRLVSTGQSYFLSRPRRFGKSLFLSTLKAYFEGRRELFKGLRIEELEGNDPDAFAVYPVFYFDFNRKNFQREPALEEILIDHLTTWESLYGNEYTNSPIEERFQHLIKMAYEQTGRRCVVLVDEYDKPLLESLTNESIEEHNKAVFKGFFSTLKSYDEYIKFAFLTGVTKFSKVSIFSDLNQLRDISMSEDYRSICGITEAELHCHFMPEAEAMAQSLGISIDECFNRLKQMYDGYHFTSNSQGVYNPFSLLSAFSERRFSMYWFATGTPTFLIKKLEATGFDAKKITDGEIYATEAELTDYRADNPDPIPLFYQTGYLTIKGYDRMFDSYELGYPNDEVKYGFLNSLAPSYMHNEERDSVLSIAGFGRDIIKGDTDSLRDRFTALFARIPYREGEENDKWVERDFQNVIYIVFMLLGQFVHTEQHSSKGRADCILETADYVYIFEFKRDETAAKALSQITEQGYDKPYAADKRTIIRIGANFNSKERTLDGWEVS